MRVIDSVRLNKYPKYNAFIFDSVGDTRQNHCDLFLVDPKYGANEPVLSVLRDHLSSAAIFCPSLE